MKLITTTLMAFALSCGTAFAEEAHKPLPQDVKTQVEQAREVHHANMVAERDRFRAEMEKLLADHPEILAKVKAHWAEMDKKIEERKDVRGDRREDRKEKREDRKEKRDHSDK